MVFITSYFIIIKFVVEILRMSILDGRLCGVFINYTLSCCK